MNSKEQSKYEQVLQELEKECRTSMNKYAQELHKYTFQLVVANCQGNSMNKT